jgi:ATP-binding protein involved in chromosome partitioning
MTVTEDQIRDALRVVQDPDLRRDIVSLGFVKEVRICDGNVAFKIELTTPACPVKDLLKAQAEEVVAALPGVTHVAVEMTAQVRGRQTSPEELLPGVQHVIAVASGKGGVGKSTVAVNLAVALAQTGAKVGLLDADIYGPSLPLMLGIHEKPDLQDTESGKKIIPIESHGVQVMSLGFLLDEDRAVIWRGPMVAGTVKQLLGDVLWGELDYLIVDLPPGTGDAPLTLAQMVPLSGVVIVMTPQQVAQDIANKSILMFRTLSANMERKIPILGVVENMSGGVFGSGGGERAAIRFGVPLLGSIPLDAVISESGDAGVPAVLNAPETVQAQAFQSLARSLAARISVLQFRSEA